MPSIPTVTDSGFSISISISGMSSAASSIPMGAWYKPFSIAIIYLYVVVARIAFGLKIFNIVGLICGEPQEPTLPKAHQCQCH